MQDPGIERPFESHRFICDCCSCVPANHGGPRCTCRFHLTSQCDCCACVTSSQVPVGAPGDSAALAPTGQATHGTAAGSDTATAAVATGPTAESTTAPAPIASCSDRNTTQSPAPPSHNDPYVVQLTNFLGAVFLLYGICIALPVVLPIACLVGAALLQAIGGAAGLLLACLIGATSLANDTVPWTLLFRTLGVAGSILVVLGTCAAIITAVAMFFLFCFELARHAVAYLRAPVTRMPAIPWPLASPHCIFAILLKNFLRGGFLFGAFFVISVAPAHLLALSPSLLVLFPRALLLAGWDNVLAVSLLGLAILCIAALKRCLRRVTTWGDEACSHSWPSIFFPAVHTVIAGTLLYSVCLTLPIALITGIHAGMSLLRGAFSVIMLVMAARPALSTMLCVASTSAADVPRSVFFATARAVAYVSGTVTGTSRTVSSVLTVLLLTVVTARILSVAWTRFLRWREARGHCFHRDVFVACETGVVLLLSILLVYTATFTVVSFVGSSATPMLLYGYATVANFVLQPCLYPIITWCHVMCIVVSFMRLVLELHRYDTAGVVRHGIEKVASTYYPAVPSWLLSELTVALGVGVQTNCVLDAFRAICTPEQCVEALRDMLQASPAFYARLAATYRRSHNGRIGPRVSAACVAAALSAYRHSRIG